MCDCSKNEINKKIFSFALLLLLLSPCVYIYIHTITIYWFSYMPENIYWCAESMAASFWNSCFYIGDFKYDRIGFKHMFAYCYRDAFCLDYDTISKATNSDDEDEEIERKKVMYVFTSSFTLVVQCIIFD